MKLSVIAVGRMKAGPERALAERYGERALALGRPLGLLGPQVIELPESRSTDTATRKAEEAAAIQAKAGTAATIVFDERGSALDSEAFADKIAGLRDGGTAALALIIGGPDGLDARMRQGAFLTLSFGAMTMPHQLVRVLVLEQMYRAMTIMSGHPYHRA